jgi:hypothetical protein
LEVTLLLCDGADESNGKLYVLGGGWTTVLPDVPFTMALAILIAVPWDQANRKFRFEAKLMTDDGDQVQIDGQDVAVTGDLEMGRPAGTKPGSPLNFPIAPKFNGISLPAGGYRWEVHIDGTLMASTPFRAVR